MTMEQEEAGVVPLWHRGREGWLAQPQTNMNPLNEHTSKDQLSALLFKPFLFSPIFSYLYNYGVNFFTLLE